MLKIISENKDRLTVDLSYATVYICCSRKITGLLLSAWAKHCTFLDSFCVVCFSSCSLQEVYSKIYIHTSHISLCLEATGI